MILKTGKIYNGEEHTISFMPQWHDTDSRFTFTGVNAFGIEFYNQQVEKKCWRLSMIPVCHKDRKIKIQLISIEHANQSNLKTEFSCFSMKVFNNTFIVCAMLNTLEKICLSKQLI